MSIRSLYRATLAVASVALLACASEAPPPGPGAVAGSLSFQDGEPNGPVVIVLEGEGADSGVPLSTRIRAEVEAEGEALLLTIWNDSPKSSSDVEWGPVLTRLGFNLADGPKASCMSLEFPDGPERFYLVDRTKPFCGRAPKRVPAFEYGLTAFNPSPKYGVAWNETLRIRILLDTECAGDFLFSDAALLEAPLSPSGGELVQWAGKFQVVGPNGEDSGCGQGRIPPPHRPPVYLWSEFVAGAAEVDGLPSLFDEFDTRAGSIELNYNGGYGFESTENEDPYSTGLITLRNGAGVVLEQWQLNGIWPPPLDPEGCRLEPPNPPQCWIFPTEEPGGGELTAAVPTEVPSSNMLFDSTPGRVTIAGQTTIDVSGTPSDNSRQWIIITWERPGGLEGARMNLRLHLDADLNGVFDDPFVTLFRVRWPGDGPDMIAPFVTVVLETSTTLIIELNVQDAVDHAWDYYLGIDGYLPLL